MEKYIRKKFIFWLSIILIFIYFEFFLTFTARMSLQPSHYFIEERFSAGSDTALLSFFPRGIKMPEYSAWAEYSYEIKGRQEIKENITNIYLDGVYKTIKTHLIWQHLLRMGFGKFSRLPNHITFDIGNVKSGLSINIYSIDGRVDAYFIKRDKNGALMFNPIRGSFTQFCSDLVECVKQRD